VFVPSVGTLTSNSDHVNDFTDNRKGVRSAMPLNRGVTAGSGKT
jgi:hypothetical protein